MIKNEINFRAHNNKDFWLHRYTKAIFLDSNFKKGHLKIRFSTALKFGDPYEGWNIEDKSLKDVIDLQVGFHNRVINDGGAIEGTACVLNKMIKDLTPHKQFELRDVVKKFESYNTNRNSTFISCWFATNTLEEENRAMWQLYSKNNGYRISIKWSDLKKQLEENNQDFEVGFVDYGNRNKIDNLFFVKDSSYTHEKEFRIVFNKKTKINTRSIIVDNLEKVYCTVRGKNVNSLTQKLSNIGYSRNNKEKLVLKESNLSYESGQVDWARVLEILNKEIISRKL